MNRKHRSKTDDDIEKSSDEIFAQCERLKQSTSSNRQELLDQYTQLILFNLDYALEKKVEHDLWTIIFKNQIQTQQDSIKQNPNQRNEIQANLQRFYEYARGYYLKLLQDVVQSYNFSISICKLTYFNKKPSTNASQCKEASILYFLQHILVHIGDLYRYSNQIDLAKTFYQYSIETIPYLGQPYNQIAILHEMKNPQSLLTSEQNQLITVYYYIRSIAIKVPFPLARSNLDKFFQRLKTQPQEPSKDIYFLILQILAGNHIEQIDLFQQLISKQFHPKIFLQMIAILMFYIHQSQTSTQLSLKYLLQLLVIIVEQCLQLPLQNEQDIIPIIYIIFAYFVQVQKYQNDLFENEIFKQKINMWNLLAKLLRSFGVSATKTTLLDMYADYPLDEERFFECFLPLNDLLKTYNYKKKFSISEKDQRQLRKLRLVYLIKNLCEDKTIKTKFGDYLNVSIKDDLVSFQPVLNESKVAIRTPRVTRNVALRQFLETTNDENH